MKLPTEPKQPGSITEINKIVPTKIETIYFILLSFIIQYQPTSTIKTIPHVLVLAFLFHSSLTTSKEIEVYSKRIIMSIMNEPIDENKIYSKECIPILKRTLKQYKLLQSFEQLLLNCCTYYQLDIVLNALDIFLAFHDHPSFTLELLSYICIRGILFGEVEIIEKLFNVLLN